MIKLVDLIREQKDSDDTAGVLYSCFNEFLLCLTERSREWHVPKGHIKRQEHPRDGALREFAVETQILLNGTPSKLHIYNKDDGTKLHLFTFEGYKKFTPRLNHEHVDWGYFTKDKLPSPMNEFIIDALDRYCI